MNDRKYQEAVTRNLKNSHNRSKDKKPWNQMSLDEAKIKLGIRKGDDSFDSQVAKLCK